MEGQLPFAKQIAFSSLFCSGGQSQSGEWPKPGGANEGALPTATLVITMGHVPIRRVLNAWRD